MHTHPQEHAQNWQNTIKKGRKANIQTSEDFWRHRSKEQVWTEGHQCHFIKADTRVSFICLYKLTRSRLTHRSVSLYSLPAHWKQHLILLSWLWSDASLNSKQRQTPFRSRLWSALYQLKDTKKSPIQWGLFFFFQRRLDVFQLAHVCLPCLCFLKF